MSNLNIIKSLFLIQGEMPEISRDSKNPFFKSNYVSLPTLLNVALPIIRKHGVLLTYQGIDIDGKPYLRIILTHVESGEKTESDLPLIKLDDPQKLGSAITYLQRYGLFPLLGLCPDASADDDGNVASNVNPTLNAQKHPIINSKAPADTKPVLTLESINKLLKLKLENGAKIEQVTLKKITDTLAGTITSDLNKLHTYLMGL
jgi:hypothetical protein